MQKLHLVGFTTDREGLIFSARQGSRSGGFVVHVDDELLAAVEQAGAAAAERTEAEADANAEAVVEARRSSSLTVRDMQARLRAGRSVAEVAEEAGVEAEWVERFAIPVAAEIDQVVERVRGANLVRPRAGRSARPVGEAIRAHLRERGTLLTPDELRWSARQVDDGRWEVTCAYTHRRRSYEPRFALDLGTGDVVALDDVARQVGFVAPDRPPAPRPAADGSDDDPPPRRPRSPAAIERARAEERLQREAARRASRAERAATKRARERAMARRAEERAAATAAKRAAEDAAAATAAKKKAAKTAAAKKKAAKTAAAKKKAARKAAAKKATTTKKAGTTRAATRKRAGAQKAATKTVGTKKAGTTRAATRKRAGAQKAATKTAGTKKKAAATRAPARKTAAKKAAAKATKQKAVAAKAAATTAAARRPAAATGAAGVASAIAPTTSTAPAPTAPTAATKATPADVVTVVAARPRVTETLPSTASASASPSPVRTPSPPSTPTRAAAAGQVSVEQRAQDDATVGSVASLAALAARAGRSGLEPGGSSRGPARVGVQDGPGPLPARHLAPDPTARPDRPAETRGSSTNGPVVAGGAERGRGGSPGPRPLIRAEQVASTPEPAPGDERRPPPVAASARPQGRPPRRRPLRAT